MYYMSFFAFCRKLKLGENKGQLCYFVININKFLIVLLINKRYNLDKRRCLNEKENINFYLFDTTNKSERDISFEILDTILTDMRSKYISILNETFNK